MPPHVLEMTSHEAQRSGCPSAPPVCQPLVVRDYRWEVLEKAVPAIIDAFRGDGVNRVEAVAAFPVQSGFGIVLGTRTDAEAGQLRRSPSAAARVRQLLAAAGFQDPEIGGLVVTIQSQESVDREYDGSWFNALR